jgi:hypothetical protein
MKHYLKPVFALAAFAFLAASSVQADSEKKMVIALKTDDFELTETDISTLAIGEGQTIETESGKVIDILRTADGVEIYIDGELLEMNFDDEGLHEEHMVRKHVEVICDGDEACDKNFVILTGDDNDISDFISEDSHTVIIHKEIELSCIDEEDGTSCSDKFAWVSEDEHIDLEELHEMHQSGEGHKVIMIKKKVVTED